MAWLQAEGFPARGDTLKIVTDRERLIAWTSGDAALPGASCTRGD
jgi:hypothetical protein